MPSSPYAQPALPDVSSTGGDTSVRFEYDARKSWYVFRTTYDREEKVADRLIRAGVYAYVPRRYEHLAGAEGVTLKSLMPNILFAYLTRDEAAALMGDGQPSSAALMQQAGFLYARPDGKAGELPEPLIIDDKAMHNFILTTATCDEQVLMLSRDAFTVKGDGRYRVTEGPFMGVVGKRIRAYSQLRILVELHGLAYLCTPYIPNHCLQEVYE